MKDQTIQIVEPPQVLPELRFASTMARQNPRDIASFKNALITAVSVDVETAESCFYSKPQDGGSIVGPSVRLAELAAAAYRNIYSGSRPGSVDRVNMTVTGEAFAIDLETNSMVQAEVIRSVRTKYGKLYSESMINTTLMAAAAIARRNAVFQVIPRVLIDKACKKAQEVASGGDLPIEKRRANILAAFKNKGVEETLILRSLGLPSADMLTLAHILDLIGRYNALKEGSLTVADAFPDPKASKDKADDLPPADIIEGVLVNE